jgi:hypothetical protein
MQDHHNPGPEEDPDINLRQDPWPVDADSFVDALSSTWEPGQSWAGASQGVGSGEDGAQIIAIPAA